ncbi:hypothetical protein WDW37_16900 [Bdellovibrionota bacterium FG-1]
MVKKITPPPEESKIDNSTHQDDSATRVDMGEDLIERAATPVVRAVVESLRLDDQLESARILMREGILDEAKRVLRRILLGDPSQFDARRLLEEVHERELKVLLDGTFEPRRRFGERQLETPVEISADLVLKNLDRDLDLGIFSEDGSEGMGQFDLFQDQAALEAFAEKLDRDLAQSSISDRTDIGIGFLEMGLHDFAIRNFKAVIQRLSFESSQDAGATVDQLLSVTGLLAYALILAGRAFEATMAMQRMLADVEIPQSRKLDLIYLMGRANEALVKLETAMQCYRQVTKMDPHYRDVEERLRRIEKRASPRVK